MIDELSGFRETFEDAKERLESVERQLAKELDISAPVRRVLMSRNCAGELKETPLVREWLYEYASFLEWTRYNRVHSGAAPQHAH